MSAASVPATALTERSATALADAIRTGETSSRAVVEAHVALLRRRHPALRAVAHDRFDAALADADAADARIAAADPDEQLPPLLGVPCTVKESIELAGMPNCAGLVSRRDHRAPGSAPAVQRLLDAGAIPLGVTNTSELCMWIESQNHVYGRTSNAYDPTRIAGGSSGGEGAAVGSGGSPFGLGSDIGGSIRLPAFFNGVFGLKPSPGLVPNTGQFPVTHGEAARLLTMGPLARRAEDLIGLLRIIAGPDGLDGRARDVALGDPADVDLAALDVIVTQDTSAWPLRRDLREARERAARALEASGARVRELSLKPLRRVMDGYLAALQSGADVTFAAELGGDVTVRRALGGAVRGRGPHTVASALLLGAERASGVLPAGMTRRSLEAGRRLAAEVEEVIGDGVLLHPPFGRVAPRHGRTVGRPWSIHHAAIFNLLGLPVVQTPLGLNAQGLPLGVQVAAPRDHDHVAIAVALELERAFGGWVPPAA